MSENSTNSKISRESFLKYTGATALGTATTGFIQNNELLGEESLGDIKSKKNNISPEDIIIENDEMRLVITPNEIGKSLTHKPTNSECLMQDTKVPVFSMVQYRPYSGQSRAHAIPLEKHTFAAHSVRREVDKLIVGFDIVDIYAIIDVTINSQYVQFSVNGFARSNNIGVKGQASNATPSVPEVDEMWFLQLPVRNGTRFGKWLNVMWNDQLAVNVLGTDPYARIDSEERDGYRMLKAGMFDIKGVKTEGTGAGLIATHPDKLLDNIAQIEEDFHLPRGALGTKPASYPKGDKFGLLDVDTWTKFVRFDQQTSLQQEVAERIANMYREAGFKFVYLDGAEDINTPYWFNCSISQWEVYKRLKPEPIFAGAAAMTHFSWHMLSRGNSWDKFNPEVVKEATKNHPVVEAPLMMNNFTKSAFGWIGYNVPRKYDHPDGTIGTQPDMLEYVISRATGWHGSPYILTGDVDDYDAHLRTPDNLQVVRRWNKARAQGWLTEKQKQILRNADQEHILLRNEQRKFELVPYDQIKNLPKEIRAFIFERKRNVYVVYWHIAKNKRLKLPVRSEDITLLEELGQQISVSKPEEDSVIIPVSRRRYLRADKLTRKQLIAAFQNAVIIG